jgi:hypothetical protein
MEDAALQGLYVGVYAVIREHTVIKVSVVLVAQSTQMGFVVHKVM